MVKKAKGKHRLDKYYHLAKDQGYRSRAAFKLIQLNRQFHFLEKCRSVLDLCAAPGGWLQVAQKTMPMSSLIIGIDLVPIKAVRGVRTIVGDITTQKARQAIKKESGGQMLECVLHDGAPNVGGNWSSEAYSQSALVLESLRLATDVLAPKGSFVTKIFRSKDYNALLYAFKQLFDKVEATKPAASRNTSAEIFVVCLGFKAPAKIDPRLLDPKHLFQEVAEEPKKMGPDALLKQKVKQKRFREGYEDGLSSTHKATSALAFVMSETPVEMLGKFSRFELEGADAQMPVEGVESVEEAVAYIFLHPATNAEVRALAADLQVLGRSEFKQLLKWRLRVKKDLHLKLAASKEKGGSEDEAESDAGSESSLDEEEKILEEMDDVRSKAAARLKKERKKRRESKRKARIRAAQLALSEGISAEDAGPNALFKLSALKGSQAAVKVGEAAVPDEEDAAAELESSEDDMAAAASDMDSDEAQRQYEHDMDEALEDAYQSYLKRKGKREELEIAKEEAAVAKRARLGKGGDLDNNASADEEEDAPATFGTAPAPMAEDEEEEAGGGLLVKLDKSKAGVPQTAAAVAARWFAQDMVSDPSLAEEAPEKIHASAAAPDAAVSNAADTHQTEEVLEEEDADSDAGVGVLAPGKAAAKAAKQKATDLSSKQSRIEQASKADEPAVPSAPSATAEPSQRQQSRGKEHAGFEEVPLQANGVGGRGGASSDDSDSDSDAGLAGMDDHSRAEVLALARKMMDGRSKQDILDSSYHRYAFHDSNVPKWFYEDEKRHMRPPAILSKEDVEAEKANMRAIDARPIKKVAEAKQRKRKRLATRLAAAKSKAEAVVGQEDLSERGKAREIEKLYAKARAGKGAKKAKPTRVQKRHAKGPPLDGRMRADKRQVDMKRKGKASKGRKGKGGSGKGKAGGAGGSKGSRNR